MHQSTTIPIPSANGNTSLTLLDILQTCPKYLQMPNARISRTSPLNLLLILYDKNSEVTLGS